MLKDMDKLSPRKRLIVSSIAGKSNKSCQWCLEIAQKRLEKDHILQN
jgi:hypothetical protein